MIVELKCPQCGISVKRNWSGSSLQLSYIRKCPDCGNMMNIVPERDDRPALSTISSGKIDAMTPAERKNLLKQRSNKDYKKNIEARKRWMDKNHKTRPD